METRYRPYRETKIKSGILYQDFIVDLCWQTIGLAIVQYASHEYQVSIGESRNGIEIKHDELYAKTGNLWIEMGEKACPRPGDYVPSGIFRNDNSWLYIIGNYDIVFIFSKKLLCLLSKKRSILENNTKTSLGFLLTGEDAHAYSSAILEPNAENKVSKMVKDLSLLGQELHDLVKLNPAQLSLFER